MPVSPENLQAYHMNVRLGLSDFEEIESVLVSSSRKQPIFEAFLRMFTLASSLIDLGDKQESIDNKGDLSQVDGSNVQHHRTSQRDRYQCRYCSFESHKATHVTDHERTHTGEKPFSCHFCRKAFSQKANLLRHERLHTGERPFVCPVCQQTFTQRNALEDHERIHTGEKPFVCGMCGRAFSRQSHLRRHERVHTGERPYQCETCGRAFSQKVTLNMHRKRNHM